MQTQTTVWDLCLDKHKLDAVWTIGSLRVVPNVEVKK